MQVYFAGNVGRKFWDSSWCPFNRGCPLTCNIIMGLASQFSHGLSNDLADCSREVTIGFE